jgi:hypothetical protein
MIPVPSPTTARQGQAIDLLLGYLESARCYWPGADGLTVLDAIRGYPQAAAAGWVPDRDELLRTHPELAELLLELLHSLNRREMES